MHPTLNGDNEISRRPFGQLATQWLNCRDVVQATRLSRATIYRLMQAGQFPKPIRVGRAARWPRMSVENWQRAAEANLTS